MNKYIFLAGILFLNIQLSIAQSTFNVDSLLYLTKSMLVATKSGQLELEIKSKISGNDTTITKGTIIFKKTTNDTLGALITINNSQEGYQKVYDGKYIYYRNNNEYAVTRVNTTTYPLFYLINTDPILVYIYYLNYPLIFEKNLDYFINNKGNIKSKKYLGIKKQGGKDCDIIEISFKDDSTRKFQFYISKYSHQVLKIIDISQDQKAPHYYEIVIKTDYINPPINANHFSHTFFVKAAPLIDYSPINEEKKIVVGKTAPLFSLNDILGKEYSLISFNNKYVLLDFWFVGCGPCIQSLPNLKEIDKKYGGKDLILVSINPINKKDAIKKYLDAYSVTNLNLIGNKQTIKDFEISYYPTLLLIDKSGIIKFISNKSGNIADLQKTLKTELGY